ncbi:SEC-C metal-binding domain-containing protein [Anaeromyxobacter sp. Fw109-5]|uniref:SEC-C metal-binding domain-containing protein n=1 Tax=Anaeromyxobacter sp. (strain Fw109-5) TaxID=404589 RepID=UPI0000ED6CCD|nr:SEC-C metal-binding domain-containing protein [Anaeromyxobacter sp. Fw109-5]ABS28203.1 SEC-C motif domain protein [Anaeromyxobacter sp. Fw109-5]
MSTPSKPSLDALLASFHAARKLPERIKIAMALVRTGARDDRILAALVRVFGELPVGGSALLATYGDVRAIPDLVRALESDDLLAKADCAICAAEQLSAIAHAIERLGGTLTDGQRARLDRIDREAARLWQPGPDAFPPETSARRPARREPRPGRNVPCPCGSGKKYKRCCALDADAAGQLH